MVALFLSLSLFIGCKSVPLLGHGDVVVSDCKGELVFDEDIFTLEQDSDTLRVLHANAKVNPGITGVTVSFKKYGENTIEVSEKECNNFQSGTCYVDIAYGISGIETGTYNFVIVFNGKTVYTGEYTIE